MPGLGRRCEKKHSEVATTPLKIAKPTWLFVLDRFVRGNKRNIQL